MNKGICKACIRFAEYIPKHRDKWLCTEHVGWMSSTVIPGHEFAVTSGGYTPMKTKRNPPAWCPFTAEHIILEGEVVPKLEKEEQIRRWK